MNILGIILLITGLCVGGFGIWKRRQTSGPAFFGGNVTDEIKELYGVRTPSNMPIIIGVGLFLFGLVLVSL
jgi:hypothetical protein